jgi:Ca2+-binding EF-hand superfamily protein
MLWRFTNKYSRKNEFSLMMKRYEGCLSLNLFHECIREAASIVETSGKPYELLALIGITGLVDEELVVTGLSKSLSDMSLRERFPKGYKIILEIIRKHIGPGRIIRKLVNDGVNLSKNDLIYLLDGVKCSELAFLGKTINDLNLYDLKDGSLSLVTSFIEYVLSDEECLEAKMEALITLVKLYSIGKLRPQDFRKLMKDKKVKVVIMRRSGKVEGVKVFMNGKLVSEGINDYVIELLSVAHKLSGDALAVS